MKKDLTKSEKTSLGTKEIAKRIRDQLKDEFKGCRFSVRSEYYSGGSSITVSLMKSDRKIVRTFDKIPSWIIERQSEIGYYTVEQLKSLQNKDYFQLNNYSLNDEFKEDHWCNGVYLTLQGHNLLRRVVQISNYYNYDDSDSMTDYYSVNFSFSLQLDKWNKPFIDGTTFKEDKTLDENLKTRIQQIEENTRKYEEERRLKEKMERLENDHVKKSQRTIQQIKSIKSATAIIGAKGFEVLTPEVKAKKILEIDEVQQAIKVKGIDWAKEVFQI